MIVTPKTLASGQVLTHHEITGRRIDLAASQAVLTVASWPSDDLSQAAAITQDFVVPFDAWTPERLDALEADLLALPDWLDWDLPGPARTLTEARAEKWTAMKKRRSELEFGGFTWNGHTFDSDAISVQKISGSAQLALFAQLAGQPFEIDFTLADNSAVTLSGAQMIEVGIALGQHVNGIYATARSLRNAIEAATSVAQVDAIAWPAT